MAKGHIFFNSAPSGAEIFLDNIDKEIKTPYTILDVNIGTYNYVLKLDGFKEYEGTVVVEDNIISTVDVTLIPNEGCIYFVTNPYGAKIYIDNTYTGEVTPKLICGLSIGRLHNYRLESLGYKSVTKNIEISTGQGITLSITLTPSTKESNTGLILIAAGVIGLIILATRKSKPKIANEYLKYPLTPR